MDLAENHEGVVGLFAVSYHHSLLNVLAMLLNPLLLCCLHLLPEIEVPSDENTELEGSPFKAWGRSV